LKILLDYVFPISVIPAVPAANTAFLKQVLVVVKPKSGQEANLGDIFTCTSQTAVAVRTDNTDVVQLFNAGMSKVYLLLSDELDIATYLTPELGEFYTILISSDFTDADVTTTEASGTATISSFANLLTTTPDTIEVAGVVFTAQAGAATLGTATFRAATSNDLTAASLAAQINGHAVVGLKVTAVAVAAVVTITAKLGGTVGNAYTLVYHDNGAEVGASVSGSGTLSGGDGLSVGAFDGVIGFSSEDSDYLAGFAATENRCGFFRDDTNGAGSMFYAFGKLLSNLASWTNQQYITMPFNDGIVELGQANGLFDDRVSFVIHDEEFGNRLGFFVAGGKAIAAPYIEKNLRVDLQGRTLSWIAANEPTYTLTETTLLENRLQEDIINLYRDTLKWIEAGIITVTLVNTNFVATGSIDISEPKALWRMFGEMSSTL
jgi:hypothetical protein